MTPSTLLYRARHVYRCLPSDVTHLQVYVASENRVKVDAVRLAVQSAFPAMRLTVQGVQTNSGVPEQPVGDDQTLQGARTRVANLRKWLQEQQQQQQQAGTQHAAQQQYQAEQTLQQQQQEQQQQQYNAEQALQQQFIPVQHEDDRPGDAPQPDTSAALQQQQEPQQQPSRSACLLVGIEGGVASLPLALHPDHRGLGEAPPTQCFAWVVVEHGATGAESISRSGSFVLPPALSQRVAGGMELSEADDQVFGRQKSGQGAGTVGRLSQGLVTRTSFHEQAVLLALLPFIQPEHYGTCRFSLASSKEDCEAFLNSEDSLNSENFTQR